MSLVSPDLPIIDVSPLINGGDPARAVAQIKHACSQSGFFYIEGHEVSLELQSRLERLSHTFFEQPESEKSKIAMSLGGRAWRGFFPVGDELTSGKPDQKEGIYFGSELSGDHPKVQSQTPLHGKNLFPDIPGFRETVLEYLDALTQTGHAVMKGIALSLGLDAGFFQRELTVDPIILFRIFHYPAIPKQNVDQLWSVGEHTDYGLLTILKQDDTGGLQVKSQGRWIDAIPVPNTFVCNIGDMLDRMTNGLYRSTPHRVLNKSEHGRLSFPFFFDPSWDAEVKPLCSKLETNADSGNDRWDGTSLAELKGTYGEYLIGKVSRVFPDLSHNL